MKQQTKEALQTVSKWRGGQGPLVVVVALEVPPERGLREKQRRPD